MLGIFLTNFFYLTISQTKANIKFIMITLQPNYNFRKAALKDVLFFYEAMSSLEGIYIDEVEFSNNFKLKFENPKCQLFVIEDNSSQCIVGCVILEERKHLSDVSAWFEIQDLYIAPKYRKLKAADFLYQQIESYIKESSIHKLKVTCKVNSTLNQNFYTKKGFKLEKKSYGRFL